MPQTTVVIGINEHSRLNQLAVGVCCLHLKLLGIYLRAKVGLLSDDTEVTYMHIHVHKKKKHKYATKKPFVCSKDVNHIHIGLDKKKLHSSNNLAMLTISLSSFLSLSHTHILYIYAQLCWTFLTCQAQPAAERATRVFLQETADGSISKVIRTKKHLTPAATTTGSEKGFYLFYHIIPYNDLSELIIGLRSFQTLKEGRDF